MAKTFYLKNDYEHDIRIRNNFNSSTYNEKFYLEKRKGLLNFLRNQFCEGHESFKSSSKIPKFKGNKATSLLKKHLFQLVQESSVGQRNDKVTLRHYIVKCFMNKLWYTRALCRSDTYSIFMCILNMKHNFFYQLK